MLIALLCSSVAAECVCHVLSVFPTNSNPIPLLAPVTNKYRTAADIEVRGNKQMRTEERDDNDP